MSLKWTREEHPVWDADKEHIVGGSPAGAFDLSRYPRGGGSLPGEWWRAELDGAVVGYGWMDVVWGDGEILLAVEPASQRRGVGAFILSMLGMEAAVRGLARVVNVVRASHPQRAQVSAWLQGQGFVTEHDSERLARHVKA